MSKMAKVTFSLDAETIAMLDREAARRKSNRSQVVREVIMMSEAMGEEGEKGRRRGKRRAKGRA